MPVNYIRSCTSMMIHTVHSESQASTLSTSCALKTTSAPRQLCPYPISTHNLVARYMLRQLKYSATCVSRHRYYALSAASALFKHAEAKLNTRFAAGSLRIRYVQIAGTLMIDPETARNLELVGNMTSRRSIHSLFGCVLIYCVHPRDCVNSLVDSAHSTIRTRRWRHVF